MTMHPLSLSWVCIRKTMTSSPKVSFANRLMLRAFTACLEFARSVFNKLDCTNLFGQNTKFYYQIYVLVNIAWVTEILNSKVSLIPVPEIWKQSSKEVQDSISNGSSNQENQPPPDHRHDLLQIWVKRLDAL